MLNINTIESGLKVECQMETAKQKTITFEFSTVDFVPEDISNEFVKEVIIFIITSVAEFQFWIYKIRDRLTIT